MLLLLLVDQVPGCVDLAQSELVVILVVEDIHEVGIEGMDVLEKENRVSISPSPSNPSPTLSLSQTTPSILR